MTDPCPTCGRRTSDFNTRRILNLEAQLDTSVTIEKHREAIAEVEAVRDALVNRLKASEARYAKEWQAFDDKRTDLKEKTMKAERQVEEYGQWAEEWREAIAHLVGTYAPELDHRNPARVFIDLIDSLPGREANTPKEE